MRYLFRERNLPSVDHEWAFGDGGLRTSSMSVGVILGECRTVPVYLRVHSGPLNTLSNYQVRQSMVGLGVQFRPWK